jgi:hypothetical protein
LRSPSRTADKVFILRFWREEAGAGGETQWRAQITDVNARNRQFVSTVEAALALVLERLKPTFNGSRD